MENKNPPQVTPYPVNLLPPLISDAVKEVAQNLNIPTDLAAHAALSAISTACQGKINISFPNFPPASCSLYLWAVSDASRGKSIAHERFFRSIVRFEEEYNQQHTVDEKFFKAKVDVWKAEKNIINNELKNAKRGTDEYEIIKNELTEHCSKEPSGNKHKSLYYAQITPQKLHETLVDEGVAAIISPEGGQLISSMVFGQPSILSSFWGGEDQSMGLIKGDRKPYQPRLTISIMTQSDPFHDYMAVRGKVAFSSGLLSRFLVSFAETSGSPGRIVNIVDEIAEPDLEKFNKRTYEIMSKGEVNFHARKCLHLSHSSKIKFDNFQRKINNVIEKYKVPSSIEVFYRRMVQHASRLAALFQYFCNENEVIDDYVDDAIDLCIWYGENYGRIFSEYTSSELSGDDYYAKKLIEWLGKAYSNPSLYPALSKGSYKFRDLQNYAGFKGKPNELTGAINLLVDRKCINVMHGKKGGLIILYPFQEQVVSNVVDCYSTNFGMPSGPPVGYGNANPNAQSPIVNIPMPHINLSEIKQQNHPSQPFGNDQNTSSNSQIEYVRQDLNKKANDLGVHGFAISARVERKDFE